MYQRSWAARSAVREVVTDGSRTRAWGGSHPLRRKCIGVVRRAVLWCRRSSNFNGRDCITSIHDLCFRRHRQSIALARLIGTGFLVFTEIVPASFWRVVRRDSPP